VPYQKENKTPTDCFFGDFVHWETTLFSDSTAYMNARFTYFKLPSHEKLSFKKIRTFYDFFTKAWH